MKLNKIQLKIIFLITAGLISGFLNGFLGTGGGIILYFAVNKLLSKNNENGIQTSSRDIFATLIAIILPLSFVSLFIYRNLIDWNISMKLLPSATLGGIVGAILLDKINTRLLKTFFSLMIIWAGFSMTFR